MKQILSMSDVYRAPEKARAATQHDRNAAIAYAMRVLVGSSSKNLNDGYLAGCCGLPAGTDMVAIIYEILHALDYDTNVAQK